MEKPKILAIDDEATVLFSIKFSLDKEYEVTTASTVEEGLGLIDKNNFSLVLLDILIPTEARGFEALAIIKKKYPNLPVIMVSGSIKWHEYKDKLRNGNASGYLSKPFHLPIAKDLIEKCLKGEKMSEIWE
jgi:DNA-binding NtrC family response regulator